MLEFLNEELKEIDIRVDEPLKNTPIRKLVVQRIIWLFREIVTS